MRKLIRLSCGVRVPFLFFLHPLHFNGTISGSKWLDLLLMALYVRCWFLLSRKKLRKLQRGWQPTPPPPSVRPRTKRKVHAMYSYFEKLRLSEKVHATIPKGIVGGFDFAVLKRNFQEWQERLWTHVCECWRKETKVGSTDTVSGTLVIPHINFQLIFSDNLSQNSCMTIFVWENYRHTKLIISKRASNQRYFAKRG